MEKQILTDARTVFAHDLDGVHYSYGHFKDIVAYNGDVNARVTSAIAELGITYEHALRMNRLSYNRYGDGFHLSLIKGGKLGMDTQALRTKLDVDYHRTLLAKVKEQNPGVLLPCKDTRELFEHLKGSIAHGVITQSHAAEWAIPVLTEQEKIEYFEKDAIFGYADFGYENKAKSDRALRHIAKFFNAKAEEMVFLEDSVKNLKRGKEFSEKLLTVYIHHGKPAKELADYADYIDMQFETVSDFYNAVAKVQAAAKIRKAPSSLIVPEPVGFHP